MPNNLRNARALVTCGATWVAIDEMRVISNRSTGEMGQRIARDLQRQGAKVTVLEGPVRTPLSAAGITVRRYTFFDELAVLLKKEAGKKYDLIVHAAAVSDYRPARPAKGKMPSGKKHLKLDLVPTPKLVERLKDWAPASFLVGFKLEDSPDVSALRRKAKDLIRRTGCDLVVSNSVKNGYRGLIVTKDGQIAARADTKAKLSQQLIRTVKEHL